MSTFTSPFTGTVVTPTDVSYYALSFSSDTQLYWPTVVNPTQVPAARIMDCVASSSGLSILLPDASQGANGTDILFRNLGSFAFTIKNAAGGASVTVSAGQARYFYLTDNTSVAGTWGSVAFGVGTSYADAAALQGAGLTTLDGKLATTQNIVDITSDPTITDSSRAATYNWGAGAGTLTLPVASSLSEGWYIGFRNNGTGSLSITPISPSLINNSASITVNPGDSGFIILDYSTGDFITVGLTAPTNVTFTAATYDVDSIIGNTFSLVSYAPIIQTYIAQSGTRTATLVVTLPAITQIYILVNDTNETSYNIEFTVEGSSSPNLVLAAGAVAVVLSDGTNLFVLTQGSTGLFYAADGSASLPSYSFNNDTHTGMYLEGTSVLGFSANSTELVRVDNSDTMNPLVQVAARFQANLIDGGTF